MTELDYEALNAQAAMLHDAAKAQGYREGFEAGSTEANARHADATLMAADAFLSLALATDGENRPLLAWARRMLGATPLLAESQTMRAIDLVRRDWPGDEPDAGQILSAIHAISAARIALRERFSGLGDIR